MSMRSLADQSTVNDYLSAPKGIMIVVYLNILKGMIILLFMAPVLMTPPSESSR